MAATGRRVPALKLGGGLHYVARRLTVEAMSRVLLAHAGNTKEWSAGLSVQFEPKDNGRGLSFLLQPSYGEPGSGVAQLWEQGVIGAGSISFAADDADGYRGRVHSADVHRDAHAL